MKNKLSRSEILKKDIEFRKKIFERDKYICLMCGGKDKKLNCSHILPREMIETRWDMNNAITLCVRCHKFAKYSWHLNPLYAVHWLRNKMGNDHCDRLLHQFLSILQNSIKKHPLNGSNLLTGLARND